MAQISAGDIVKVVVKFTHPYTSTIENVWHLIASAGAETVDDTAWIVAAQDFLGTFYGEFDNYLSDALDVLEWVADRVVFVVDHWETIEHITEQLGITGFTPGASDAPLPAAAAGLLRLRTDAPKHEGRKYLAPFTEIANDTDGEQVSALTTSIAAAGSDCFDEYPYTGYTGNLRVVIPDVNQNLYRYVDNVIARAAWAYQRRRKRNVGI